MATLRQLRMKLNLKQSDLASLLKVNPPEISNYENGTKLPILEDMIILEKYFAHKITWQNPHSIKAKQESIQDIVELSEKYPIEAVLEFAARHYRRSRTPDKIIHDIKIMINEHTFTKPFLTK